jgi:hypothetical protein
MTKKPTPFTHVNDIYSRSSQFKGDEGYSQYVINKELSKNGELIDLVNVVQQYYFYSHTPRGRGSNNSRGFGRGQKK